MKEKFYGKYNHDSLSFYHEDELGRFRPIDIENGRIVFDNLDSFVWRAKRREEIRKEHLNSLSYRERMLKLMIEKRRNTLAQKNGKEDK